MNTPSTMQSGSNPTSTEGSEYDELDHILGICDCLPPHDWLYSIADTKVMVERYASTVAKAELEKLKAKIYMDVPTFETHNGKVWLEVDSTDKEFDEAIAALGEPPRGDSND